MVIVVIISVFKFKEIKHLQHEREYNELSKKIEIYMKTALHIFIHGF